MPGPRLDRIDRKILAQLMRDATLPLAQLAERVGLSQTPCWKRVQKLEAAGMITARVALVDPAAIGLALTAFVTIEAPEHTPQWRDTFGRLLPRFPQVVEVHRIAGGADYLLKVHVADMSAFDAFYLDLTRALPCRAVTSTFSMEAILVSTALPLDTQAP